jgi:hypothetical protein
MAVGEMVDTVVEEEDITPIMEMQEDMEEGGMAVGGVVDMGVRKVVLHRRLVCMGSREACMQQQVGVGDARVGVDTAAHHSSSSRRGPGRECWGITCRS